MLSKGRKAIDAVEAGVRIPEANPDVTTVGYGGYPGRDGKVTLDACIMDENQNCGSVAFYTTEEGMADIGYVGNKPIATFLGSPPEVLNKLGLDAQT